jgi:para-nitrobenzyl esterase
LKVVNTKRGLDMMYLKGTKLSAMFLLALMTISGCSPDSGSQSPATTTRPEPAMVATDGASQAKGEVAELVGTSWRLVKIMGMDDSVSEPDDRSLYTLEFGEDGRAAMQADCNRGTGTWTSESPGTLQFGPVAATRAMCPPGSLSDAYLSQFEWARSYVMKTGHLFMATMADGSIIELEPAPAASLDATGRK